MTPDLATFGKAIANGFPVAALAGRADLHRPVRHRRRGAWRHLQRPARRDGGDRRDPDARSTPALYATHRARGDAG